MKPPIYQGNYYEYQCSLKHNHRIEVGYNFADETFEVNKEQPLTEKDKKYEEKKISNILKNNFCEFCNTEVKKEELAGFSHEEHNSLAIDKPICQTCWTENKERIEHKDEYYCSLNYYLEEVGVTDTERDTCPVLPNYPKKGKKESSVFNDFDREYIAKFESEVDIETWQRKKKLYGKISDEQKFFILEYLCYLRDHYYRDSNEYKQFQVVIEMIRNIYRNEQNIKENDGK
ncbi:protein of unknown function [endosymbiont DhMRE of Dentiscutata heterogama]|uniref:hypothetical protein n=1 Tax=endosymbiont DhMRE of Dentiscutata heterogama TaxID=1609546 RepID=UPI000629D605|nr:hypothetical protein [endosymbiont DhMRE of Dentiscutata heterogama]CFW93375.1 protein of unknown function [endosymbiont DhMRE of Dentiscutata heterogama]